MNHRNLSAPTLDRLIERLQLRLKAHATVATREWWTKYLRGAASFRGVKMGDVRKAVHAWFEEERLGEHLSVGQQKVLVLMLLEENYSEDKLAGVLFLQDWICVKALGPLAEQQDEACARAISEWREAESVWQRRASVVAFANLAREGDRNFPGFTEMVLDNCADLLGSRERFAQTGVGWVLRELCLSDEGRVVAFVEANLGRFSREALKNAIKYLQPEMKERLLQAHLTSGTHGRRKTIR
jgi:hypothetical protein